MGISIIDGGIIIIEVGITITEAHVNTTQDEKKVVERSVKAYAPLVLF